MKKHITFSILFTLLLSSLLCNGQTGKFYSTDNGLSNSLINQIYQDKKGFIWISTEYGLNKFDGINFSIYTHISEDSLSLKNNYVRAVFEDNSNNIFVGTIIGLMKYERATDSFEDIKMYRENKVVRPHVTSIIQTRSGDIWVTTSGQGIFRYHKDKNICLPENSLQKSLSSTFLNLIFEDSQQNIWIGSENDGLNRYSPFSKKVEIFNTYNKNINSDKISAITQDREGNIFIGTLTQGLSKYNVQKKIFEPIPCANSTQPLLVSALMINRQDQLYIGTDGQGLKFYNQEKNIIEDYEVNYTLFDFSKGKIHSIMQDRDANIWLGMFQKGVVFIPTSENRFGYIGYKSFKNNPIGSSCVTAIHKDNKGIIWIGTDNDGIYGINDKGLRVAHFYQTADPSSAPNIIHSIYEDSHNNLWLGSYSKGLAKLNRNTGKCEYIQRFVNERVYCITEDNENNLLVGTYGSGLFMMNLDTKNIQHYESSKNETDQFKVNELCNDWVNYMLCDSEGLIWIGHYKGLSCFNPQKNTFINYMNQNNLLPGSVVLTLLEDRSKNIWIGTTMGLYFFDKQKKQMKAYTTKDGLSNDVVCGLSEDDNHNIWISTYQGISKYNVADNTFSNYYAGDGLQGNEFSRNAVFKDDKGKIFFGGINGITNFYPRAIIDSKRELKVLITNFYRFNQPVKKGDKSGSNDIITTSVSDADIFTLSHRDNTFSLEFSTLDFSNPERISYQYMIENLNTEWMNTHTGVNRVTYNNLASGKYVFKFRAYDGQSFSEVKTVQIIITPPWYQTWWAFFIYAIIIIILGYGITHYIISQMGHRRQIMEKEHAEKINEAKLQFFINISHEIRTPMTLIINPLKKLLAEKQDSAKHKTYMMIYRNAQRILRLINQLMDMQKIDKGQMGIKCRETDIVGFIEDLMLTFEYPAQTKNIKFVFEHEAPNMKVWIDLKHFDKVLVNILSNAFKYTSENGEITVKLITGEDLTNNGLGKYFEISVTDSGIGIDKDKIEKIFERFYQINNDQTNSNFGTGIGLHLSHLFVQLHRGIIFAENREDRQGCRFVIRLPLGNSHLTADEFEEGNIKRSASEPYIGRIIEDSKKTEYTEDNEPTTKKSKSKYRILIAEDEDEIRNYIKEELADEYKIIVCKNGKEALETILKEKPDLIISDVMMPETDGITLCRKIKQNININHIPVILLTAKSKTEDKLEGLEIGADAYIVKPYDSNILKQTISNLIQNRERLRNKFSGNQEQGEKIQKIEMKSYDEILLNKIIKVINENLANPSLNVEMLASNIGLSRVHVHRKLKELTSQSARDFIRGIRLKQAAILLADKKHSISEVGYAVGFSNLSHFSNSFKEFYGVSPTEYAGQRHNDEN